MNRGTETVIYISFRAEDIFVSTGDIVKGQSHWSELRVETVSFQTNVRQTQRGKFLHNCTLSLCFCVCVTHSSSRESWQKSSRANREVQKHCKDCSLLHFLSQSLPSFLSIVVDESRDSCLSTPSLRAPPFILLTQRSVFTGRIRYRLSCLHGWPFVLGCHSGTELFYFGHECHKEIELVFFAVKNKVRPCSSLNKRNFDSLLKINMFCMLMEISWPQNNKYSTSCSFVE